MRLGVFLRPTFVVIAGFAVIFGVWRMLAPGRAPESPLLLGRGAVTADNLDEFGADDLVLPSPTLAPEDVVRTQLRGLADPAGDGLGILQCYCFASPGNRSATGPLDRFGQMVRGEAFVCLARPRATLIGKPQLDGRFAKVLVTVVDEHQRLQAFTFILFKQSTDPFKDCWMTEAVYPSGTLAPPAGERTPENLDEA